KYLFMSVQHPSATNTSAQTDATGASVVFNTHTTIVIARKEFLGVQDVVLPVTFMSFDIKEVADRMQLNWSVANVKDHSYFEVERSVDGINFKAIGKVQERINNRASAAFQFIDKEVPLSEKLYYRIKQCDENKSCYYSPVQEIKLHALTKDIKLYPVPVSKVLQVKYIAATAQTIDVHIINSLGTMVTTQRKIVTKGYNTFSIETSNLPAGKYILLLQDEKGKRSQPFTKQ
ncbi:MAG TPA: T9SS type A sorting domain-containing protein, partial [Chitinophagaceae bacterium]|nr:T9SS type A sorting domain-containing protein [Chitinophagaceae bacterium]